MYPADWIWQQYGLCLGWRCSQCKEKVLARSLPFKGLRKRKPDPDEMRDRLEAAAKDGETHDQQQAPRGKPDGGPGRPKPEGGKPGAVRRG